MIGIVFIGNLIFCPYIEKYKKLLTERNVEFEVLYWNRESTDQDYPSNYISYNRKSALNKNKLKKVGEFLLYRNWLKKQIKLKKYKKMIILDTLSGILLNSILTRDFAGKYIFDIRDYSYEGIKPFYNIEKKVISSSYFTCISSKGFENFLPSEYAYTKAHNFNYDDLDDKKKFVKKEAGSPLNIVWNGTIRYFHHQSSIIKNLQNDSRFNIYYHGIGPDYDSLKQFCIDNSIENVYFTGKYNNNDKAKLLAEADIINNSYGTSKKNEVLYAISNKYYDGLIFGIPQLVENNTYKSKRAENLKIGIGLELNNKNFADELYKYYFSIDEVYLNDSLEKELHLVLNEDALYMDRILDFIEH